MGAYYTEMFGKIWRVEILLVCHDCGREFSTAGGLGQHRRHAHRLSGEYPALDPRMTGARWSEMPWERITVVDRGFLFEEARECWQVESNPLRYSRLVMEKLHGIDLRDSGLYVMHLCEKLGERNLCIRPEHLRVGTPSENALHSLLLGSRRSPGRGRPRGVGTPAQERQWRAAFAKSRKG
jgi:hypothetical protein